MYVICKNIQKNIENMIMDEISTGSTHGSSFAR